MTPTRRALVLLSVGIPLALIPAVVDAQLWTVWASFLGGFLALVGVDAVFSGSHRELPLSAESPELLYIGDRSGTLVVTLGPSRRSRMTVAVLTDLSEYLESHDPFEVEIFRDKTTEIRIPLVPTRRGKVEVTALWLRWRGPFGLMQRVHCEALLRTIPVTPNVKAVRAAAVRFFDNRQFLSGLKMQRFIGDGSEFDAMREYVAGFDLRSIDWKSSARHNRLMCREFRAERNHQIYLAFDTGYLMSEPIDGIPRLDHAINVGLLLAFVCFKTGDRVGLFAFDDKVRGFSAPAAGVHNIHRLQRQSADLAYGNTETNFTLGLTNLLTRLRRRSLIVVFTEFVDTITAELMLDNVQRLARRHLVIFVTFSDPLLESLALAPPQRLLDLNRATVAFDFAREREVVLRKLKRMGVHCIEAPTNVLPVRVINRYLEIKRREMV